MASPFLRRSLPFSLPLLPILPSFSLRRMSSSSSSSSQSPRLLYPSPLSISFFIFRHGERVDQVNSTKSLWKKIGGKKTHDVPLTDRGKEQAKEASRKLIDYIQKCDDYARPSSSSPHPSPFPFPSPSPSSSSPSSSSSAITPPLLPLYVSPLLRAVQTAEQFVITTRYPPSSPSTSLPPPLSSITLLLSPFISSVTKVFRTLSPPSVPPALCLSADEISQHCPHVTVKILDEKWNENEKFIDGVKRICKNHIDSSDNPSRNSPIIFFGHRENIRHLFTHMYRNSKDVGVDPLTPYCAIYHFYYDSWMDEFHVVDSIIDVNDNEIDGDNGEEWKKKMREENEIMMKNRRKEIEKPSKL